jgi:hypothetical protein
MLELVRSIKETLQIGSAVIFPDVANFVLAPGRPSPAVLRSIVSCRIEFDNYFRKSKRNSMGGRVKPGHDGELDCRSRRTPL